MLDPTARDHFAADRVTTMRELAARSPIPARAGNIPVGSASWTDPTLVKSGLFYPRGTSTAEKRLRYYASRFSMVEVDASYYALPTPAQARVWVDRTPDDFVFNIKAYAAITGHPMELRALPKDLKAELLPALATRRRARPRDLPKPIIDACHARFVEALQPLVEADKLGAVLLQFPPWLTSARGAVRYLAGCRDRLGSLPLAVEFRHRSWVDPGRWDRIRDVLKGLEMNFVAVDTPGGYDTTLPPITTATNRDLAMVRFHGRNRGAWDRGGDTAAERFDWLYSEQELAEWVGPLRELSNEAETVHAVFNNCTYDAAQLSGYGIAALLTG
ncbi:MAG: DUF72 domain-containing protein [Proteobacteria bacterium]|nr:DUF72 domain-containing protein [Pseudomonadota bacterium]